MPQTNSNVCRYNIFVRALFNRAGESDEIPELSGVWFCHTYPYRARILHRLFPCRCKNRRKNIGPVHCRRTNLLRRYWGPPTLKLGVALIFFVLCSWCRVHQEKIWPIFVGLLNYCCCIFNIDIAMPSAREYLMKENGGRKETQDNFFCFLRHYFQSAVCTRRVK
jgi:hypothetical protein